MIAATSADYSQQSHDYQSWLHSIWVIQAKVEHPFLYIKRHFGYAKVRYRGLSKNTQRLMTLLGFANLMRAEQYLAA